MNTVEEVTPSTVLMKAFNNACADLKLNSAEKSELLGLNSTAIMRNKSKGFPPESKVGEIQLNFVRIYQSLYTICNGDISFMNHWFITKNWALHDSPSNLCKRIDGMFRVNFYLNTVLENRRRGFATKAKF